jgi:1-acyl-sn-glycerol-3-phosphate acyltransferase
MLASFRARQPGAPLWHLLIWSIAHVFTLVWMVFFYRYRAWHADRVPRRGPLLIVANHQSFLDPLLVGVGLRQRPFFSMARSTLFKNPLFARLIRLMNAFPVERGTADTGALRHGLKLLGEGQAMLIFPEGTRSLTGVTGDFAPGLMLLVKRGAPTVLPVAIDGAFAAWPKGRKLPSLFGHVGVMFGEPISSSELAKLGTDDAMKLLRDRVERLRLELRKKMQGRQ